LLGMKARGVDDVINFPFLSPPPRESLEKALLHLLQIGALNEHGGISDIGLQMAKLSLTPTLGRVIVEASRTSSECLRDIVDIVSCLTVESIFLNVAAEEKREEAEESRKELYRRDGDHLTLLATVRGYASEQTDRKAWSEKYFISHRAMQNVAVSRQHFEDHPSNHIKDVRKQLFNQCKQLHLLPAEAVLDDSNGSYSEQRHEAILKCLLSGFATNTARLTSDGSYKTLVGNQTVTIHPSSVLLHKQELRAERECRQAAVDRRSAWNHSWMTPRQFKFKRRRSPASPSTSRTRLLVSQAHDLADASLGLLVLQRANLLAAVPPFRLCPAKPLGADLFGRETGSVPAVPEV
jgi:ATP-dependent RNA helicase DHR2